MGNGVKINHNLNLVLASHEENANFPSIYIFSLFPIR